MNFRIKPNYIKNVSQNTLIPLSRHPYSVCKLKTFFFLREWKIPFGNFLLYSKTFCYLSEFHPLDSTFVLFDKFSTKLNFFNWTYGAFDIFAFSFYSNLQFYFRKSFFLFFSCCFYGSHLLLLTSMLLIQTTIIQACW